MILALSVAHDQAVVEASGYRPCTRPCSRASPSKASMKGVGRPTR